jgi:hypothetical protein
LLTYGRRLSRLKKKGDKTMNTQQAIKRHQQQQIAKQARKTGKAIPDVAAVWSDNAASDEINVQDDIDYAN